MKKKGNKILILAVISILFICSILTPKLTNSTLPVSDNIMLTANEGEDTIIFPPLPGSPSYPYPYPIPDTLMLASLQ